MGEVWSATDTKLDREVALKVLPAAFTEDQERLARFEREAKLLAQLNHPNIAQIYGLETSGMTHALVMELVPGPTLAERLQSGPLSLAESLSFALQITQALEEAHDKGIIHRDLKPQNIKASSEGTAKVLDFGLAKAMDPTGAEAARSPALMNSPTLTAAGTQLGTILGTAAYMAPEQAKGASVDRRADVWAFGVILHEMLAGGPLFKGDSVVETLSAVMLQEIDLASLPDSIPPSIRGLLARCLVRNPKNRLRDIGDARIALEAAIAGSDGTGSGRDGPAPARRATRRELGAWIAAASAIAVAAAFAVLLARRPDAAPTIPRFEKLTYAPQFISNARFAADGRSVILSSAREGNRSELFVRQSGDPQPRPLGRPDTQLLSVSAKGELAVLTRTRFLSHRTYIGTLARMPLAEASPREVLRDVTAADWSPDGAELAVIREVEGKSRLEYPIGKVLAETTGYLSDLRISPRGDRIAYMPHEFAEDNRGRVVVIDRSGTVVTTSPEYWGEEGLAWSADGDSVYFSASDEGPDYRILALAMNGAVRDLLVAPTGLIVHDRAPDGRLLVSTHLERGAIMALLPGDATERDMPWLDQSVEPTLSRDGRSLIFGDQSRLSGKLYSVLFRAADGSPPVRLGDGNGSDLSPDGASVLAVVMDDPPRLMIYPIGAGETRDISAAGFVAYEYETARFIRDGRSVAYCGNAPGKASRCYVRDLADGAARAVTPEGTREGRISPDGTSIVARGTDGLYRRFALGSDGAGEGQLIPGLDESDEVLGWRANGRSLHVFRSSEVPVRVEALDLATGRKTLLRELAPDNRVGVTEISAVSFSDDESAYAYDVQQVVGTLYAVEGLK